MDEGKGERVASPAEGESPRGTPALPNPTVDIPLDALCEDCSCSLRDHSGSKGNCVYCACKVFVPVGPKS